MGTTCSGRGSGFGQMKLIPMLIFTLFWCGITGVFVGFIGRSFYRSYDAQHRYVQAEGVVLSSEVQSSHDSDGSTYGFGIRYRYSVDGAAFESDRFTFGAGKSSNGHRRASDLVRRYPAGSRLTLYYDPRKPSEAVVERQADPMMTFLVLFIQPFVLVGVGMLGACIWYPFSRRALRRFVEAPVAYPLRVPTWGELRLEEAAGKRYVLVARKGVGAVLMALAAGYGLTCFLSIFVVGFLFGGFAEPKPGAVVGALVVALCAGITAALFSVRASRRKMRLVVDAFNRTVALEGPSDRTVVRFADLGAWVVGSIENPRRVKQEGAPATVPLLSLRRAGGDEIPVHVFEAQEESGVIAARIAEILAGLTGHPAVGLDSLCRGDARTPADVGSLVKAALAALKEQKARANRLRDLT